MRFGINFSDNIFQHYFQTSDKLNVYDFLVIVNSLLVRFIIFCILCIFADNVKTRILEITNIVYNSEWNLLPVNMQKTILKIICYGQRPIKFTGFGIVICSMESLTKVKSIKLEMSNSVYSLMYIPVITDCQNGIFILFTNARSVRKTYFFPL